jgi:hypothetical protein
MSQGSVATLLTLLIGLVLMHVYFQSQKLGVLLLNIRQPFRQVTPTNSSAQLVGADQNKNATLSFPSVSTVSSSSHVATLQYNSSDATSNVSTEPSTPGYHQNDNSDKLWNRTVSQQDEIKGADPHDGTTNNNNNSNILTLPQLQQLNHKQIREYFDQHPLSYQQIPHMMFPTPPVDDYDMIAIYSQNNWHKLRNFMLPSSSSASFMFVNGASSLTGVGVNDTSECGHAIFAKSFRNMTLIDRSHGNRNTFHATQCMHSYFPAHANVLLWEFSINDLPIHYKDPSSQYQECRNLLYLYLDQVARVAQQRDQDPPLVILLYLWDWPFHLHPNGKLDRSVFDAHQHLAEQYDFVVGHVNLAKYMESLGLPKAMALDILDTHHPNVRGHLLLAYLLNDLLVNEHRREKPKRPQPNKQHSFQWMCGDTTPPQRLVRDLMLQRYPVASFTEEIPKNDKLLHGMLDPTSTVNVTVDIRAQINILRHDRQGCIVLPCCHTANVTFHVARYSPIQGMQVNLSPVNNASTTIFFDDENVTDRLISAEHWHCSIGYWTGNLFDWVVLEEERNVSEIAFCNHMPTCGEDASSSRLSVGIMSMAVYGGRR